MFDLQSILCLTLIAIFIYYWRGALHVKDCAYHAAQKRCKEMQVQLLDEVCPTRVASEYSPFGPGTYRILLRSRWQTKPHTRGGSKCVQQGARCYQMCMVGASLAAPMYLNPKKKTARRGTGTVPRFNGRHAVTLERP